MKSLYRRSLSLIAALLIITPLILIVGCSKKEEPTAGGNYYTGPMTNRKNEAKSGAPGDK